MSGEEWIMCSDNSADCTIEHLKKTYEKEKYVRIKVTIGKQRSNQQSKALHVYLGLLADALNSAGLDMRKALNKKIDIPWTKDSAKEYLWRPVQEPIIGEKSTTKAERSGDKSYNLTHETLTRFLAQKFGLPPIPWPIKKDKNEV